MAHLSSTKGKPRLRYRITFPDRTWKDRSRRYRSKFVAKSLLPKAADLEQKTKYGLYTRKDIDEWRLSGFLNVQDVRLLGFAPELKTLQDAAEEYKHSWDVSAKEAEARECRVNTILSILHMNTPVRNLSYKDGLFVISELRAKKYKVATIQKHVQDLKRMINLQIANNTIEYNPFLALKGGRIPQVEKIKHITLTDEQISSVVAESSHSPLLGGWLQIVLLLAFGCGLRRGEMLATRWENIDWDERSLKLTKTKTGKARKVGLGQRLYYELLLRKKSEGFILPQFVPWTLSRAFRIHLSKCGLRMRLHDARHTYTSLIQQKAGAKPIEAMARTGHQDMRMLSHYSHGKFGKIFEDEFGFMKVLEGKDAEG